MSARRSPSSVVPSENYPTPSWCVRRLLEALPLPSGAWLEPCVGEGAICDAVDATPGVDRPAWTTWDIRPVRDVDEIGDARELARDIPADNPFRVCITNPPFSLAAELFVALRPKAEHLVFLLRLNWLASASRHPLLAADMPAVWVLPNRPCFVGGKSDATEYAWMHWGPGRNARGSIQLLRLTSPDIRRGGVVERLAPAGRHGAPKLDILSQHD
jgi:hypothetical protein